MMRKTITRKRIRIIIITRIIIIFMMMIMLMMIEPRVAFVSRDQPPQSYPDGDRAGLHHRAKYAEAQCAVQKLDNLT
jgi:hypothetical protein